MTTLLKRTTVIVRDAERLRRFYEEVLGWRVYYDSKMRVTGKIIPLGEPGAEVQLYIMGRDESEIGRIGILQWTDPTLPDPGTPERTLKMGGTVFVADCDDIQALRGRILAFPGAAICVEPVDWTFPAPDGSGDIELTSMSFFDPEGALHEVYYRHNRPNPDGYLIRRTTTVVRDVEASIAFYRDALGMSVYQDSKIPLDINTLPVGAPGEQVRLVVFKAEDPYIGMIGVLEFPETQLEDPGRAGWDMGIGKVVFVGGTSEADALFQRVEASGVRVTCEPFTRTVPKSGGAGETPMTSMGFYDPDGQLWEVNQRG